MIRYMICPIIGDGQSSENPFRAAVIDLPDVNTSSIIPSNLEGTPETNPEYGHPKYNFAFCVVGTANVSAIAAITNAYVFPDYNLDGRMDGMELETRTAFVQSVEAYNLDGEGFHFVADNDDAESWRTVIERIVRQIEPVFVLNNINVREIAG